MHPEFLPFISRDRGCLTCPAKAYQVEVEKTVCVIRLRPAWPAFMTLNGLKWVPLVFCPRRAFSPGPEKVVPDLLDDPHDCLVAMGAPGLYWRNLFAFPVGQGSKLRC